MRNFGGDSSSIVNLQSQRIPAWSTDPGLDLQDQSKLRQWVFTTWHSRGDRVYKNIDRGELEIKFQSRSRVIKLFHRGTHGTSKRLLYTMLYHREGTLMNPNGRRLFEL